MRITITIEDSDQGLSVRSNVLPAEQSSPGQTDCVPAGCGEPQAEPEASNGFPSGKELGRELHAGRLLKALNVDKPGKLLKQFRAERIIEVCEAAERKKSRIKSPAGYIIRALRQGWAV